MEILLGLLLALQGTALAALYLVWRGIRVSESRLTDLVAVESRQTFRQLESLHALYVDLDTPYSLARTRDWAASPDFLRALEEEIFRSKPRHVIELGSGVSTIVVGMALKRVGAGHLWSIDHDPRYAAESRTSASRHGINGQVTVIDAPLAPLSLPGWEGQWYRTEALPVTDGFDLMVVDGPPFSTSELARYPAIPVLFDKLKIGAAIYLDDADRKQEKEIVKRWCIEKPSLTIRQAPECEKGLAILVKG